MLQHLIVEGFVEGEKIALQYNDLIGSSGMPAESDTERKIRRIQVRTLTRLLADSQVVVGKIVRTGTWLRALLGPICHTRQTPNTLSSLSSRSMPERK